MEFLKLLVNSIKEILIEIIKKIDFKILLLLALILGLLNLDQIISILKAFFPHG